MQCSLVPGHGGGEDGSSAAPYPGMVEGRLAAVQPHTRAWWRGGWQQCSPIPGHGGGEAGSSAAPYPGMVEGRLAAVELNKY